MICKPKLIKKSPVSMAGFTLIELLVALAIFAVLSLAAWQVFDGLMKARDRATIHANRLVQWQNTYEQLLRDTTQILARPTRNKMELLPALSITTDSMQFCRIGSDTDQNNTQSSIQRIRYEVSNNKLWRLLYTQPDNPNEKPLRTLMMSQVSSFQVQALDPDAVGTWPPSTVLSTIQQQSVMQNNATPPAILEALSLLPKGIEVRVTVLDVPLVWKFVLAAQSAQFTGLLNGGGTSSGNNTNSALGVPITPTPPASPPNAERKFL